jgi:hypothetical protein
LVCDDCGIETGRPGDHGTDVECMEALKGELELFTAVLRAAREEIMQKIPFETRDCPLFDKINNTLHELAGGDREATA